MTWNYRVIEFATGTDDAYQEIHEVYYDEADRPTAYGANPAIVSWDASEGADTPIRILEKMKIALGKPVLTEHDFPMGQLKPRMISLQNGQKAEVSSACGMEGLLCATVDGQYFFRAQSIPTTCHDYAIKHSDMAIKIVDSEAFIYKVGDECFIDHAPETLGLAGEPARSRNQHFDNDEGGNTK